MWGPNRQVNVLAIEGFLKNKIKNKNIKHDLITGWQSPGVGKPSAPCCIVHYARVAQHEWGIMLAKMATLGCNDLLLRNIVKQTVYMGFSQAYFVNLRHWSMKGWEYFH